MEQGRRWSLVVQMGLTQYRDAVHTRLVKWRRLLRRRLWQQQLPLKMNVQNLQLKVCDANLQIAEAWSQT